jgi:hypothetical protein
VTVNIPSDFPTLQAAIDRLSKQPVRHGARIILNIESGHALTAGINVSYGDYGRFWIQSVDAEVPLAAGWPDSEDVMFGNFARLPVLDCLINAGNKGRVGCFANNGSSLYVRAGAGIKNMGNMLSGLDNRGLGLRIAHSSRAAIGESIFSGAGSHGIQATQGVLVHASAADFSNAGGHGLFLSRGAIFHGHDCNVSGATLSAVRAGRSYASVRGSNLQNAGEYGIWAFEGSIVAARGANCSGAGLDGVQAFQGGAFVDISAGTITNCTQRGIRAVDGSNVVAEGATISGNGDSAIWVSDGATIHARGAVIDGTGGSANTVRVSRGSHASLTSATITNSPGNGIRFEDGASGSLTSASITGSGVRDMSIVRGSIVSAQGTETSSSSTSTDFPDVNDTDAESFNSLSSRGILFA